MKVFFLPQVFVSWEIEDFVLLGKTAEEELTIF